VLDRVASMVEDRGIDYMWSGWRLPPNRPTYSYEVVGYYLKHKIVLTLYQTPLRRLIPQGRRCWSIVRESYRCKLGEVPIG